ncbi:hypothetical protein BC829DRAFT_361320, partial [Chytridium lagenaria]
YPCSCGNMYKSWNSLKSHVTVQATGRPFQCSECDKSYQRNYELKRHSLKHNGERRRYRCVCGTTFARVDALVRHEKNFSCSGGGLTSKENHVETCSLK